MIKLSNVVDCMDMCNDEIEYYYNPDKKEIFMSNIGEFEDLNEDELDELFSKSIMLPNKLDIHEYRIIEELIETIEDNLIHNQLLISINGKGAFRRFKDTCINFNIIEDWYNYRYKKYQEIAINWCKRFNIKVEIDVDDKN